MKLLNLSIKYMSVITIAILCIWSVIFYFSIYREIKSSVDEGLDNYKRQLVYRASTDSTILSHNQFSGSFFTIEKIGYRQAVNFKDQYSDTLLYMQDADDEVPELEPVRLLKSAFEHKGEYYEIRIISPLVEKNDLVKQLAINVLILFILLFATIVIVNNFALRKIWNPFYKILDQMKTYRLGQDVNRIEIATSTDEFNDLKDAINTMLAKLNDTFMQQKLFIANASHELQTPLAIINNKIEMLVENGRLDEQQIRKLNEISEINHRIIRLNRSLLLLSKIENNQFTNPTTVSVNQVVDEIVAGMEELVQFKNMIIKVNHNSKIEIRCDESLAIVLISNLIRNALQHNPPQGEIEATITNNTLEVSNTGNSPLDGNRIFDRFYKSGNPATGSGLGLSIVKAICSHYGYQITYSFVEKTHNFRIKFN